MEEKMAKDQEGSGDSLLTGQTCLTIPPGLGNDKQGEVLVLIMTVQQGLRNIEQFTHITLI